MSFIFQGIGAAASFIGSGKAAKAEKEAGRSEKLAADMEALQLDQNANQTVAAATFNAGRVRKKFEQIKATAQAEAAARGGLDGSYSDIQAESVKEAGLDQLLVMADAEAEADRDRFAAKIARTTGERALATSKRRASSTLLSGWGQAASDVYDIASGGSWKTAFGA